LQYSYPLEYHTSESLHPSIDVPGVREHYDDMGQGQVQLLLAYGDRVTGPDDVTAATPEMNRLGG